MVVGARLAGLSISETAATGIFPHNHSRITENRKKKTVQSVFTLLLFTEVRQERPYSFKLDRKATVTQPRYADEHTGYHSCKLRMGNRGSSLLELTKIGQKI